METVQASTAGDAIRARSSARVQGEEFLLRSARRGDLEAFETLYRGTVGRVHGLCRRLTGDHARSEDLVQEVYVKAWQKLDSFRGDSAFSTWLHSIAVNEVLGDRRSRQRRGEDQYSDLDVESLELLSQGDQPDLPDQGLDLERAMASSADRRPFGVRPARRRGVPASRNRGDDRHGGRYLQGKPAPGTKAPTEGTQMKTCRTSDDLLQDFVDGVLSEQERQELDSHLGSCVRCRDEVESLRSLIGDAAQLGQSVEPEKEIWPAIESRIRQQRPSASGHDGWTIRISRTAALAAAAALFLVAVTASVTVLVTRGTTDAPGMTAGGQTGDLEPGRVIRTGEDAFLTARRALLASFEDRRGEIPPDTLTVIEENHRILLAAQRDIAAAIERDPGNTDLAKLLAATYRREIELLQQAVQLPATPEPDSSQRSRI